ncbi:hypothetical protein [Flagellimonas marina]|uniref:Uncharacterized protein n=1 Tax=Flagellimonas marina TaxID=1775168 RepID=A0ABV8PJF7_9FLAO
MQLLAGQQANAGGPVTPVQFNKTGDTLFTSQSYSSFVTDLPDYTAGDVWIKIDYIREADVTFTDPVDWTSIVSANADTPDGTCNVTWYRPNGTEGANVTTTTDSSTTDAIMSIVLAYSNVTSSGTPYEGLQTAEVSGTHIITPVSVTSTVDGGLHVDLIFFPESQPNNTVLGEMTENYFERSAIFGSDISMGAWSQTLDSGESSTPEDYTFGTGTGYGGRYVSFILKP